MERVTIFRDSSPAINRRLPDGRRDEFISRKIVAELGYSKSTDYLARTSQRLRHLALSFFIDAWCFFEACHGKNYWWPHLESLALTFEALEKRAQRDTVSTLLCSAANAARNMPKLKSLSIWWGGKNEAVAYIFEVREFQAILMRRGTYNMTLSDVEFAAWREVAVSLSREFEVQYETITEPIHSHGDAIHYLRIPCEVVQPVSLWQIRVEAAEFASVSLDETNFSSEESWDTGLEDEESVSEPEAVENYAPESGDPGGPFWVHWPNESVSHAGPATLDPGQDADSGVEDVD